MKVTRKAKGGKPPEALGDWMTLGAAGRALGEHKLTVLKRIVTGELIAEERAGYTFIRRDGVDTLLAARAASIGRRKAAK